MNEKFLIEQVSGIKRIKFFSSPTYNDAEQVINEIADNFPDVSLP